MNHDTPPRPPTVRGRHALVALAAAVLAAGGLLWNVMAGSPEWIVSIGASALVVALILAGGVIVAWAVARRAER